MRCPGGRLVSRRQYQVVVRATGVGAAFHLAQRATGMPLRSGFILVEDTAQDVVAAIHRKRVRVLENLGLYGDKLAEYDRVLREFEGIVAGAATLGEAVVSGMFLHGDARLDNPRKACVVVTRPGEFAFFGFDF